MADYNFKSISADTDGPSADTELLFGAPDQSSGTPKPYSFAGLKLWVKSWIAKADVDLGNVANTKHNFAASAAPAATDDAGSGYSAGSLWVDTTAGHVWLCIDATTSAAQWTHLTQYAPATGGLGVMYYGPMCTSFSGGAITANYIYMQPIFIPKKTTLTALLIQVRSAVAGNARVGLYSTRPGSSLPNKLLADGGEQSVNSTGDKTFTISVPVSPGWYLGAVTANVAANLCLPGALMSIHGLYPSGGNAMNGFSGIYRNPGSYAAFPADESAQTYTAGYVNAPIVVAK